MNKTDVDAFRASLTPAQAGSLDALIAHKDAQSSDLTVQVNAANKTAADLRLLDGDRVTKYAELDAKTAELDAKSAVIAVAEAAILDADLDDAATILAIKAVIDDSKRPEIDKLREELQAKLAEIAAEIAGLDTPKRTP